MAALALIAAVPARAAGDLATYVRARAAEGDGRVAEAARDYAAALAAAPDNAIVARRAYREALQAGDDALAVRAAAALQRGDGAPPDAALLAYAGAIRARDAAGQSAALARIGAGPFAFLLPPLLAWQAYDRHRDPFAALDAADATSLASRYAAQHRALLLIALGRGEEGVTMLQAMLGQDQASLDLRIAAAQLLAARGTRDLAATLLTGNDPAIAALRRQLGAGAGRSGGGIKPSSGFGVSLLYSGLAGDLAGGEPTPFPITLARAALLADPGNDRARLLLAQALSRGGAADAALAALDAVGANSPFHDAALEARVTVLRRAGQANDALQAAQALSNRRGAGSEDAGRVGDLLVDAGRPDEAVGAYALAIERAGGQADWTHYFQLGGALDEAGRWPEARAALERAVALGPDQPVVLNYLGYARLEHGEELAASLAMLERASALAPDDASIADSLGWGYFRRGEVGRALPILERASRGAPANAVIAEHLGDAYWTLGRRYEARYAWRAAALVARPADAPRLSAKIADGLIADGLIAGSPPRP